MGSRTATSPVVLVAVLVMAACVAHAPDAFTSTGFSMGYGYELRYRDRAQLLPDTWRLDNYRRSGDRWIHKDHGRYRSRFLFDDDNDGHVDTKLETFTYALRFESRTSGGEIWLRHIPLTAHERAKDLRSLARAVAEAVVTGRFQQGRRDEGPFISVQGRLILEPQRALTVAGRLAWTVTVNVVDASQVQVAPIESRRTIQLVLMFAPRHENVRATENLSHLWGTDQMPNKRYAVLIVAGYENTPRAFADGFRDFQDFVNRIAIDGKFGISPIDPPTPPGVPNSVAAML